MTTLLIWTCAISVVTAVSCSICGVYLVAKREALISEGLGHAVLPGIIVGFLIFEDRASPWLLIFAAFTGMGMVILFQLLRRTQLVDIDASLGIVFSAMFSGGVILSSQNLRNVHFHPECIIDGNIAAAALDTLAFGNYDLGPRTFWVMLCVLIILISFVTLFYKEMNVMAFDESFAEGLILHPNRVHLIWLGLVSLTTVCAFETAGSILVVALMIAPPAAAYLLSTSIFQFILWSGLFSTLSAVSGVFLGYELDISPAGPIASCAGLSFLCIALFAPKQGLISKIANRSRQRHLLFKHLFLKALGNSSQQKNFTQTTDFLWTRRQADRIIKQCLRDRLITEADGAYEITDVGSAQVQSQSFVDFLDKQS